MDSNHINAKILPEKCMNGVGALLAAIDPNVQDTEHLFSSPWSKMLLGMLEL
jgi:hypothetical protein